MWPPEAPAAISEGLARLAALADVGATLEVNGVPSQVVPRVREAEPGASHADSAEQSRRLAEARYQTLIEQIPAVTFLASLAGGHNEIYVSPQIESLLGFTQAEWISDPVLWYRQTHPADRDRVSREFAALCLTGQSFKDVVRVINRSGETVWVHAEARLVRDREGKLLFLQGVGFDVTEQFRAREAREQLIREQTARAEADRERDRLRELFTGLPAAITLLRGADHTIEFMNPVAVELADRGSEVIGKPFREVFVELGHGGVAVLDRVLATGKPYFVQEMRVGGTDGRGERFFNFSCQPMHDYRGPIVLVHAVDVTEPVRARRAVEEALHLREEFLSIASHELKTPVAALRVHAQLMLRRIARSGEVDVQQVAKALQAMNGQTGKLTRLIDQLLDVSRLESGKLIVERERIDLVRLVEHSLASIRTTTDRHAFHLNAPASLEADVDPLRLEQVLSNLLNNAVKYSPDGGDIEVSVALAEPDSAELSVRDHGLGIPPENRTHIFDRFYQAHEGSHRSGLGLGLYICRQIAETHGGTIRAEFPPDGGTRFRVRLPLRAALQAQDVS